MRECAPGAPVWISEHHRNLISGVAASPPKVRGKTTEDFTDQELMFELVKRGYCVMDGKAVMDALEG